PRQVTRSSTTRTSSPSTRWSSAIRTTWSRLLAPPPTPCWRRSERVRRRSTGRTSLGWTCSPGARTCDFAPARRAQPATLRPVSASDLRLCARSAVFAQGAALGAGHGPEGTDQPRAGEALLEPTGLALDRL